MVSHVLMVNYLIKGNYTSGSESIFTLLKKEKLDLPHPEATPDAQGAGF